MAKSNPAMADRPEFHIITGGPGSGKTTLIDAFAAQGFHHMPEAGWAIIRNQQRDYIDWALRAALSPGIEPEEVLTEDAAILLAARLKTPLQIGRHLVRAFEAGFGASVKPIDAATIESILSRQIDDLEPQLTRHGYDTRTLAEQFDARPAEIRKLLRGSLDPVRAQELTDEMRAAGLPV